MRWIFRLIGVLLVAVIAAVAVLFFLPTERIGQLASDQLERTTGRSLQLSGRFSPSLYPTLGVKTGPVKVSNADWASDPWMIEASGVVVGVKLSALLGGDLEIQRLSLEEPVIRLEKAADGRVNWDLSGPVSQNNTGDSTGGSSGGDAGSAGGFTLANGSISNGQVYFADHSAGTQLNISDINVSVSMPGSDSPARLNGTSVWQGTKVAIDAEVVDLAALQSGSVSSGVFSIEAGDATISVNGTFGQGQNGIPTVSGDIKANAADVSKTLDTFGLPPLQAPIASVTNTALTGNLQLSSAGVFLRGDLVLDLNGTPFSADLTVSGQDDWTETTRMDVAAKVVSGTLLNSRFDGWIDGASGAVKGMLEADSPAVRSLLGVFVIDPEMPDGTFNSVSVSGYLTADPKSGVVLEDARLSVDKNHTAGRVAVQFADKPIITARLSSDHLDLSGFVAEPKGGGQSGSGQSTTTTAAQGWSKEPIGLKGLDAVDADVKIRAQSVDFGVSKLGLTDIAATLRNGLLTLNLIDVRAFQGAMNGTVTISGGNRLSFTSDVLAKDMQLQPLLGQLIGVDRLIGKGTTRLNLSGTGASIHEVMNSLSGSGNINFFDGAIRGIDLAAMMQNLKSAFGGFEGATEFTSMTGSFEMTKGVLDNVDLSLISPLFKALGEGKVNLGGQSMDYTITPSTLTGDAEFSVPVFITGPWSNLSFKPDLSQLVNLLLEGKLGDNDEIKKAKDKLDKLKEELENPEDAAKRELEEELMKELQGQADSSEGAGTDEPQKSLEDQLKEKAENELENALKKLFD